VTRIKALFNDVRMVTLMGAPGSGKTRLGIRAARELAAEFADGVFLVELAPIRDADLVASAIAHTLGLQEIGTTPVVELLKSHLDAKRMLLLLDNFEHLLQAAVLIAELLASASEFKVLATSRAALDIRWEQQYLVEPLVVPKAAPGVAQAAGLRPYQSGTNHAQAKAYATLDSLRQCPSVALFLQRARAVRPGFDLSTQNAFAVAEICRRLDGLPLAIELITAHVKTLSPAKMLERLQQDTGLLTGARQDAPLRHQTMRMAIESSHELLTEEEKILFRRLSVFVGGFTLESAEAVCGSEECARLGVGGALSGLVNKSMVSHRDASGEPRLTMLEVIREYGLERLEGSGEADATYRRHAQFFCVLAERNDRPRQEGETLQGMLAVLDTEIGNLRAAMGWSRDNGDPETVLRIASSMRRSWATRGSLDEGWRWLNDVLSTQGNIQDGVKSSALGAAGILARLRGNYSRAIDLIECGLLISRSTGDRERTSELLDALGCALISQGCHVRATELLEEALTLSRQRRDTWSTATILCDIGSAAYCRAQYRQASDAVTSALELYRELGDKWGGAMASNNLATMLIRQGKYEDAARHLAHSLRFSGDLWSLPVVVCALENSALLGAAAGHYESTVRILAGAQAGRKSFSLSPESPPDQADVELALSKARRELGPDAFATAWEEGSLMTLNEAMSLAREEANVRFGRAGPGCEFEAVPYGSKDRF
jgi:predicted ATPase